MAQYHELLNRLLTEGVRKGDRTGTGTIAVFDHQMRCGLAQGFPLIATKKLLSGMAARLDERPCR